MPQLTQLSDVLLSQLFWLAITLGFIYFVIARGMLPKIQSTVDLRDQKIAQDLTAAESARAETDKMEEAYRERMDASRADAMKLTAAAKSDVAKAIEKKVAKADATNQAKLDKIGEPISLGVLPDRRAAAPSAGCSAGSGPWCAARGRWSCWSRPLRSRALRWR